MKVVKYLVIALFVYVGIVVAFESMIGILQPTNEATLVITTTDADGNTADRVLARLESGGNLYIAANHWPRAWYRDALANPEVEITLVDEPGEGLFRVAAEERNFKLCNWPRHQSGHQMSQRACQLLIGPRADDLVHGNARQIDRTLRCTCF